MQFISDCLVIVNTYITFLWNALGLRKRFESNRRLDGKVVLITGGNTGLGKETAYELSLRGPKGLTTVEDIEKRNPNANITAMKLDLSSLTSVRQFAKTIGEQEFKIDILINNDGVMACPEWQTEDGFEMQFTTNHLGHFLLTLSLMGLLKNSSKARIVNVSAALHINGRIHFENIMLRNSAYTPLKAYSQSKLANILFTRELTRRLGPESNVNVYSLHPGIILTELARNISPFLRFLLKFIVISTEMGVQTTLYCALDPSLDSESGFYYDDCNRVKRMISQATDDKSAKRLWELSCDLVKLEN